MEINPSATHRIKPVQMLLVYGSTNNSYLNDSAFYIESHQILDGKPLAGQPLDRTQMLELGRTLVSKSKSISFGSKGMLPRNVIFFKYSGEDKNIAWYVPGCRRQIYFVKSLNIPNGSCFHPNMIFLATNSVLRVFAVKDSLEDISEKTKLYCTPYPNIDNLDGSVCMGDVRIEDNAENFQQFMANWENAFFNSNFSHYHGSPAPYKRNINSLWRELIETGSSFPYEDMPPMRHIKTLGNLLS